MEPFKMSSQVGLCLFFFLVVDFGSSYMVGNNPYHRWETLDPLGKFHIQWLTDLNAQRVTFNATVETLGYIGFGFSAKGALNGSDVIIGGVRNGQVYFSDRHGDGNQVVVDGSQDWELISGRENGTHTFLSFSRAFDSCDPQDYVISEDKVSLMWSYGDRDNDDVLLPGTWGFYDVYLIGPNYVPTVERDENGKVVKVLNNNNLTDLMAWTVETDMVIPDNDTTYWCTVHTPPKLEKKHHIVGMEMRFADEASRSHVHHVTVYKCHTPPGVSVRDTFNPLLGYKGNRCFIMFDPQGPIRTDYCTELFWTYGIGTRIFFFPPHVGMPLGEQEEYFTFQLHYDNPERVSNARVKASIDWFYTANLRPNDGGALVVRTLSHAITPAILVPPGETDHKVYSHCSPDCTRRMIPTEGIKLLSGLLHSHNSGVKINFQHFRGNQELAPILKDDNFQNTYQEHRALHKDVVVLPGDHLTVACTYDNTWAGVNGTVVAGFTTRQEMCLAISLYYTRIPDYNLCTSEIVSPENRQYFLGFTNITWSYPPLEYVVDAPHKYQGMTVTQVSNNYIDWTPERRAELQKFHLEHPQTVTCDRVNYQRGEEERFGTEDEPTFETVYPANARPYQDPPSMCSTGQPGGGGGTGGGNTGGGNTGGDNNEWGNAGGYSKGRGVRGRGSGRVPSRGWTGN